VWAIVCVCFTVWVWAIVCVCSVLPPVSPPV
jgi:hypothetical protein